MPVHGANGRVYPKIASFVAELRGSPPRIEELPPDPEPAELARAYATLATRVTHVHERIADALDELRRPPTDVRVLWTALLSVLIASAVAMMALGFALSTRVL